MHRIVINIHACQPNLEIVAIYKCTKTAQKPKILLETVYLPQILD